MRGTQGLVLVSADSILDDCQQRIKAIKFGRECSDGVKVKRKINKLCNRWMFKKFVNEKEAAAILDKDWANSFGTWRNHDNDIELRRLYRIVNLCLAANRLGDGEVWLNQDLAFAAYATQKNKDFN